MKVKIEDMKVNITKTITRTITYIVKDVSVTPLLFFISLLLYFTIFKDFKSISKDYFDKACYIKNYDDRYLG